MKERFFILVFHHDRSKWRLLENVAQGEQVATVQTSVAPFLFDTLKDFFQFWESMGSDMVVENWNDLEAHNFLGRSDRDCEICGFPDRADCHL